MSPVQTSFGPWATCVDGGPAFRLVDQIDAVASDRSRRWRTELTRRKPGFAVMEGLRRSQIVTEMGVPKLYLNI